MVSRQPAPGLSDMGWSARFDDPIPLPAGRALRTLREAGDYVTALPSAIQRQPEWQTAAEMLLKVAERGWPIMFADIAMRKALAHGEPEPPRALRKKRARKHRTIG